MAMVVCVDAYGRDYNGGRSETVMHRDLDEATAKHYAEQMNKDWREGDHRWYVVKPDDYKPYVFEGY